MQKELIIPSVWCSDPFQSELRKTEREPELPPRHLEGDSIIAHDPRPDIPQRSQAKLPDESSIHKPTIAPMFETWYHGGLPRKQVHYVFIYGANSC